MANITRLHEDVEDAMAALDVLARAGHTTQHLLKNRAVLGFSPQQIRDLVASQAVLCAAGQRLMLSLGEPGLPKFGDILTMTRTA